MSFPRRSGILLHPTSLPGEFGIGDLGPEAFRFVDLLAETGQTYWQILPLGPTGYGDSPYQSFSAFAGNTLLISQEKLANDGLIGKEVIADPPKMPTDKVDFGAVYKWKSQMLSLAYEGFQFSADAELRDEFGVFCRKKQWWLDDYALYRSIKSHQDQKPWFEWSDSLKLREEQSLGAASEQFYKEIQAEKFYQFLFFRQWQAVREYANKCGVKIIGDIPIFVALDSADVWCNQDKFKLDPNGTPTVVSGVPPDYFSKTGQLWGNPIYNWDAMRDDGFGWWIERFRSTLEMVDIVRIDHFRGFASAWEVPGGDKTAENGQWVNVPGKELFTRLKSSLNKLPVIAEDLGFVTPEVEALRDSFGFPGMRILQFAFGGDAKNLDLPHNYISNCVAYTGTHDNDTVVGWFTSQLNADSDSDEMAVSRVQEHCLKYLNSDGATIHWDFIRAVWASVADTAMAPMQDILGLGNEARMNLPATTTGNWQWCLAKDSITAEIALKLKELTETYGRAENKTEERT
ncbi:MAG: 4-alpha-glucanotransferase [Chloracidobacterium sp.]|nr:4-alpha-glucanotransferase [Chloracidobacterium sp.]